MTHATRMPGPTLGGAPLWLWVAFHALLALLLLVDFLLTRNAVPARTIERRSYWLTGCWIAAALLFTAAIHKVLSPSNALEYLTGYGIEEALSVDNLFVFLVLFRMLRLPPEEQRRVLFYGVAGAIAMRAGMIAAGLGLLDAFSWMNYVFGVILVLTAWHLFRESRESEKPPRVVQWLMKRLSVNSPAGGGPGGRALFLTRENGRWRITPAMIALIAIELTDALFATDSVPAVLAISHHPFVVYSSNIFAVIGLRSLYFTLAAVLSRLHKLHYGLAGILLFVGLKMLTAGIFTPPVWVSLAVIALLLAATAVWSMVSAPPAPEEVRNRS